MLTSDKEVNRDFDINNLFLNLDFQHQEETFEYKWALLDHPSNYQLIITKLLTRTSLPYIKLHDLKKQIKETMPAEVKPGEPFYYDYLIKLTFQEIKDFYYNGDEIDDPFDNKFLDAPSSYTTRIRIENLKRFNTTSESFSRKCFANKKSNINNKEIANYVDAKELKKLKYPFCWFDSGEYRNIYSLREIIHMINNTLASIFKTIIERYDYLYELTKDKVVNYEDLFYKEKVAIFKIASPMYVDLYFGVPTLYVLNELLECLQIGAISNETLNNPVRKMELYISKNLFQFLRGLPFVHTTKFNGEFCQFILTKEEYLNAESYTSYVEVETGIPAYPTETKELHYRIFRGEELNIMELSDYIGLAITSPDFPIKEQIYPQFHYDFEGNLFKENRRRYVPFSESCIIGTIFNGSEKWHFKKENVSELTKYSTGDKILFVKYFDPKTEDLNAISYENNNSATTLKMDLMNVMPLKKFTLKLYLIDRYNNFEPLYPKIEGYNDVIKLQLLFTRIKGDEKENRNIIETKIERPERVTLDLVEEEEEEEEENEPENNNEPEIPNEPENPNEPEIIQVPAIEPELQENEEENEEEDLEPPPEKVMYIANEEGEENSENELY